jgi:hypothetical protein
MTPSTERRNPLAFLASWFDTNCASLGREMRLSYLPPLMVYLAAGISGLTGIVGASACPRNSSRHWASG